MANTIIVQKIVTEELLDVNTRPFQVADGTVFYWDCYLNAISYTTSCGMIYSAKLPDGGITNIGVYGNALYFEASGKVYKAYFAPPNLALSCLREKFEGEEFHYGGFCSRKIGGKLYVYRMSDISMTDIVHVDAVQAHSTNAILCDVQSGKAIYVQYNLINPIVQKLSEKVSMVGTGLCSVHASYRDEYGIFYTTNGADNLFTLDTETMEFLPTLEFSDFRVYSIVGVHNGKITVRGGTAHGENYLRTAQLPDEFFAALAKKRADKKKEKIPEIEGNALESNFSQPQSHQNASAKETQIKELIAENEQMKKQIEEFKRMLIECTVGALATVRKQLKFDDLEKLSKPFVTIQLQNGTIIYFDNAKPFELFTINDGTRSVADLHLLNGENDCTFRGAIDNAAYFSTIRGKLVKFFSASVDDGKLKLELINEMKTSDISLFKNQPLYFIEKSKEWVIYQYDERYTEMEGDKFDISEIDLLSKYERHYHRGILYLFRETSIPRVEKVNEKVVIVEGPLLDETSFYTPPHSDCIYITNSDQNVLLIMNTIDLTVSQLCYEPLAGSNNHSIVGIYEGMLTMAFDGVWGRSLATTKLP